MLSVVLVADSSNSTFILNNFLKSSSISRSAWYIVEFPTNNTFKSSGIGSGFSEISTIEFLCSVELSIANSFTLNAFFNAS